MLIKLKFDNFPSIFFGMLLAGAIFWMGMIFSPQHPSQSTHEPSQKNTETVSADPPQKYDEGVWPWITKDAAGFFTFLLVVVGGVQALLFYVQLKAIREALGPARDAAAAAKTAAEHIPVVEGAHVYVLIKRETVEEDLQTIEIGTGIIRPDFMIEIRVSLKNFGKTPAVVERFNATLSYVSSASTRHGAEAVIQPKTIIGAGEEVPTNSLIINGPVLSQAEAIHIRNREARLILNGRLVYSDIWGDEWTVTFDGRNGAENEGFRLDNYPRRKETQS